MAVAPIPGGPAPIDADAVIPAAAVPPAAIVGAVETPAVVEAPVVAPVVETPAVVAPVVETPVVEAPKLVTEVPSLLEETLAPGEKPAEVKATEEKPIEPVIEPVKPVEAPKVEEAPKVGEDGKPIAAEAPKAVELAPVEYKYEVPEGIAMPEESRVALHAAVDAIRSDPTNLQPLMDLHAETLRNTLAAHNEGVMQRQHDTFNNTRADWKKQIKADPEIGGNGYDTTMQTVARVRDSLISDAKPGTKRFQADVKAASDFFRMTGAGDHPVFIHMLHRAARYMDEPSVPAADIGAPASSMKTPGSRREKIYTHPSSSKS